MTKLEELKKTLEARKTRVEARDKANEALEARDRALDKANEAGKLYLGYEDIDKTLEAFVARDKAIDALDKALEELKTAMDNALAEVYKADREIKDAESKGNNGTFINYLYSLRRKTVRVADDAVFAYYEVLNKNI